MKYSANDTRSRLAIFQLDGAIAFARAAIVGLNVAVLSFSYAQAAHAQADDRVCTPTRTVRVDAPDFDWRRAEEQDRSTYEAIVGRTLRAREISAMFERPTSMGQLLHNIKIVVDADLLVQPHFFEQSVILKVFGASSVKWQSNQIGADNKVRIAAIAFDRTALSGLRGAARLVQEHVHAHDITSVDHVKEHIAYTGRVNLYVEPASDRLSVQMLVDALGMPLMAYKTCEAAGYGLIPTNDKCKGELRYDYSKSELKSAKLAFNQAAIRIWQDNPERSSPDWTIRTAEGRKRFLCDEDEIRDISLMQEGH
jgi:hypothetical protein